MRYFGALMISGAVFMVVAGAFGGEAPLELTAGKGMVEKADKEAVTVQLRGTGGKFAKKAVLKITGTSKLTMLSMEKRGGKLVPVQREIEAKDLEPNQPIAVIYVGSTDAILVSGVAQRAK
jgi:hypothetical protein